MHVGVALGGMPRLLQDIVSDILQLQPELSVTIIEDCGEERLIEAVRSNRIDVLITAAPTAGSAEPPIDLLYARSSLRVLDLESDGRTGVLYSLEPSVQRLTEVSPSGLLAAIRRVAKSSTDFMAQG